MFGDEVNNIEPGYMMIPKLNGKNIDVYIINMHKIQNLELKCLLLAIMHP